MPFSTHTHMTLLRLMLLAISISLHMHPYVYMFGHICIHVYMYSYSDEVLISFFRSNTFPHLRLMAREQMCTTLLTHPSTDAYASEGEGGTAQSFREDQSCNIPFSDPSASSSVPFGEPMLLHVNADMLWWLSLNRLVTVLPKSLQSEHRSVVIAPSW